ncbi:hypothetical protein SETIT_7G244100v2 [Setaria italica]|uniref:cysteine dioxygenase n=2 Tax=Setaria italica TaxID=4555 RepID=A0A368RZ69_SETIT|nr:hypothetical protein SETIT_7G244100v2 [Setaria italica]
MTTLTTYKAPPPPSSLFPCCASLLVVRLNLVTSFISYQRSPSSLGTAIPISSPFVADTPSRYYRRIGYISQLNLKAAWSYGRPTSSSLSRVSDPGAASQVWSLECGTVSGSAAMEGNGEAGELAACGGEREMANPVAQGAERRREDGDVRVQAAFELVEAAGAGASRSRMRCSEQEMGTEAMGPGDERRQRAPATALSGRKRRRDEEPEAEGTQQAAERLSATPVQQPAVAPAPLPLQRLLDACRAVFGVASAPPMASIVPYIRGIMDTIRPDDVGLRDEISFFNEMNTHRHQNPPIITCKTIHQCNNFTIAVFFLPLRSVMPLHDHPGMTVFSKLLIGSARLEAYDWVHRNVTATSRTWVLFPDGGGNLHRFTAMGEEHCALLDVLTPPYAPAEQRACTYYQESSQERSVVRGGRMSRLVWLKEVPVPRNLRIVNLQFQGSQIL